MSMSDQPKVLGHQFTAIREVLAAYRSTVATITEEQITAAWAEYDSLSTSERGDAQETTHATVALDYLKTLEQNDLSHALRRAGVDELDEPVLSDSEIANARVEALAHALLHIGDQLDLLRNFFITDRIAR